VKATRLGLVGDEQAGKNYHGGEERAILQYDSANYKLVGKLFPEIPEEKLQPPGFGENFSAVGMNEKTVCVGDRYKIGSVIVEVTQPRKPCYKLNHQFQTENFAETVQNNSVTGWFYRVITEGEIQAEDEITLLERPYPKLTISHVMGVYSTPKMTEADLKELLQCAPLPECWKSAAEKRIKTNKMSNEKGRLVGASNKFVKT